MYSKKESFNITKNKTLLIKLYFSRTLSLFISLETSSRIRSKKMFFERIFIAEIPFQTIFKTNLFLENSPVLLGAKRSNQKNFLVLFYCTKSLTYSFRNSKKFKFFLLIFFFNLTFFQV